jgi:hypothetical protein
MLDEIAQHFSTDIVPLPGDDWDAVEDLVKRVIKNKRAGKTTEAMQTDGA